MQDPVVTYSVGSTLPTLAVALTANDAAGTPVDLTDATAVVLSMTNPRTGDTLSQTCTVVTAGSGVVSTEITSDVTEAPTEWRCRYAVTFPSDRVVHIPTEGWLRVRVE